MSEIPIAQRLFGRRKADADPTVKVATAMAANQKSLENFRTKLKVQQSMLQKEERQLTDAVNTNRRQEATRLLKSIKLRKTAIAELDKKLNNLENLSSSVDMMAQTAALNDTYARTLEALRAQRATLDADKVNELVDSLEEEMEDAGEIDEAFSRPIESPSARKANIDEDELANEVDHLFLERIESATSTIPAAAAEQRRPPPSRKDTPWRTLLEDDE